MKAIILLAAFAVLLAAGCNCPSKKEAPTQPAAEQEASGQRFDELLKMLRDPAASTRESAAIELGELGDSRAVPALIDALGDENIVSPAAVSWDTVLANYRATISGALSKITGENFGPDYAKWKEWQEQNRDK